jgi:hypothetical protein
MLDLSFVKLSLHIVLNISSRLKLLVRLQTLNISPHTMAAVIVPTPQRTLPSGPVPPEQFAHVLNVPPQTVILPHDYSLVTPRDEIPICVPPVLSTMPSVSRPVLIEPVPAPVSSDCGKFHLLDTYVALQLSFEGSHRTIFFTFPR